MCRLNSSWFPSRHFFVLNSKISKRNNIRSFRRVFESLFLCCLYFTCKELNSFLQKFSLLLRVRKSGYFHLRNFSGLFHFSSSRLWLHSYVWILLLGLWLSCHLWMGVRISNCGYLSVVWVEEIRLVALSSKTAALRPGPLIALCFALSINWERVVSIWCIYISWIWNTFKKKFRTRLWLCTTPYTWLVGFINQTRP